MRTSEPCEARNGLELAGCSEVDTGPAHEQRGAGTLLLLGSEGASFLSQTLNLTCLCSEADVNHVKRCWQPRGPGAGPEPDFKLQYLRLLTNREGGAWCDLLCSFFQRHEAWYEEIFIVQEVQKLLQRPAAWNPNVNRYLVEPSISRAGKEASL